MKSGIVIVDKPQSVTSHDMVAAVRSRLGIRRVGHAGTLDPMATGVLVIAFGQATRLLNVIVGHDKTYETTIRLGQATDTDDADGTLLPALPQAQVSLEQLDQAKVEEVIANHYLGHIQQVPNAYSAIKVNGVRAYELARQGKAAELKARDVVIGEFSILSFHPSIASDGQAVIDMRARVTCSSGTYIRALARDLGRELGVGGHLTQLRRTRVGRFDLLDPKFADNKLTAHVVERSFKDKQGNIQTRKKAILDQEASQIFAHAIGLVDSARASMPTLAVNAQEAQALEHGQFLPVDLLEPTAAILTSDGNERLVALLERFRKDLAKPSAVFTVEKTVHSSY